MVNGGPELCHVIEHSVLLNAREPEADLTHEISRSRGGSLPAVRQLNVPSAWWPAFSLPRVASP